MTAEFSVVSPATDAGASPADAPALSLKFLTLRQPWASLVAMGVKSIETRSWSTSYRGQLAIHAGATWPKLMHLPELKRDGTHEERDAVNHQTWMVCNTIVDPAYHGPQPCNPKTGRQRRIPKSAQAPTLFWPHSGPWYRQGKRVENPHKGQAPFYPHSESLPLGAVVAVADLVDVLPIIDGSIGWTGDSDTPAAAVVVSWDSSAMLVDTRETGPFPDITEQLPFGDFTPGRFAWLLDDVRPIDPVPMKGAQGLRDVPAGIAERIGAQL